jgi:pimeloyl-ACP methyl ester carboxylesterase
LATSSLITTLAASVAAQPAPEPYREEEVVFDSGDVRLAGTLTLPVDAPRAGVVLLTGSGAQNRDEELFGFRPFKVIADHLARQGVAVLRYDDRGVGGSSGSVVSATTREFARDAMAAHALIKARAGSTTPVGLLGHSEGALAAAIAAADSREVAFIVLMAGSAERGDLVLRRQAEDLSRAAGGSDAVVAAILAAHQKVTETIRAGADRATALDAVRALVRAQLELAPPAQRKAMGDNVDALVAKTAEANIGPMLSPWFRAFLALDPAEALSRVSCPVLALFGERDLQVPAAANRAPLEAALARANNDRVTVKVYPEANHLFIKSVTGNPSEYPTLEKIFVPGLLNDVSHWILAQTKR